VKPSEGKRRRWRGAMLAATCFFNLGPNDNHIEKLLGQKMMDEIDYFVSCILIFQ
jgi:hypothetical protein